MAERRYVRLAIQESVSAEIGVAERQLTIVREAATKSPSADAELLVLQAETQVQMAKAKASLVKLPELQVRVITIHPDDKAMSKAACRIDNLSEFYDNQLDAFTGRPQQTGANQKPEPPVATKLPLAEVLRMSEIIAEVKVELDGLRRDLLKLVLADKQSGEVSEELIRTCTPSEISTVLKVARWPELLPSVSPLQSSKPPTSDSTPSAT